MRMGAAGGIPPPLSFLHHGKRRFRGAQCRIFAYHRAETALQQQESTQPTQI